MLNTWYDDSRFNLGGLIMDTQKELTYNALNYGLTDEQVNIATKLYDKLLEKSVGAVEVRYYLPLARRLIDYLTEDNIDFVFNTIITEAGLYTLYSEIFQTGHGLDVEAETLAFIGNTIVKEILIKNREMN
jgi:hypothetical protein